MARGGPTGAGLAFEEAIDHLLARVLAGQLEGPKLRLRARTGVLRRVVMTRFPYDVVYLAFEREIVVIAIAHQRRKPGFWRRRLRSV